MMMTTLFSLRFFRRPARRRPVLMTLAVAALLAGCEKKADELFTETGEPGAFVLGGFPSGGPPAALKYAPGERVPVFVGYNAPDNLRDITVFQVVNRQDSAVVITAPAGGTFDPISGTTVQRVDYVVPAGLANALPVRVDLTSTFQNGGTRLRRFSYTVADAPTLRAGTPAATFRNNLGAAGQTAGDLIGYALVLNEGGVSAPPVVAPARLFKSVDSLVAYAQVGTGAFVRQLRVAAPTAGAANSRTVDVRVPATATAGQAVTFRFVAFAGLATPAALTTAPVTLVAAPVALGAVRRGTLSFGAGSAPDSLAFNLRTGLPEPAANPAAAKDLQVSGLSATGALTLNAPNTTRYLRLTAAQAAATPLATATASAVAQLLVNAPTTTPAGVLTADLGPVAVGDMFAVRVRGAEPALLRVIGIRPSTTGGIGRVRFEYRLL